MSAEQNNWKEVSLVELISAEERFSSTKRERGSSTHTIIQTLIIKTFL